jgi:threonine dehydratase
MADSAELPVTFADVQSAAAILAGHAHRTPVLTSRTANEMAGAQIFFKAENLQRGGAFKFRGAFNALSRLSEDEKRRGVVAFSSGNHAQAVALAGKLLGIPRVIVMPDDAPAIKVAATAAYGAEVVFYNRKTQQREAVADALVREHGCTLIPPFDHPHIIAGQGTATKELIEETGPLDWLVMPCGGAGLLSGNAISAYALAPQCKVVGVEPEAGDDVTQSFKSGAIVRIADPDTIADGARTNAPGKFTFPIVQQRVHDMITVSDDALIRTMKFFVERMKIVVEPTGALGAAAVLEGKLPLAGARVGVIISGGNVDPVALARYLAG